MIINVVFSGGGIKGLAYVGALRFLEGRGYKIFKAGGSSVGALFAALVVAGYSSKELVEIINDFDIEILQSKTSKWQSFFKIADLFSKKGFFSMQELEIYIADLLAKKNIYVFKDVKFGDDYLLKIIVTELSTTKMVVIPDDLPKYNIKPDNFSIAKAVVMSCNIPLLYYPYSINGYTFIDGGVSDNYPIWLFEENHYDTVGFKLSTIGKEKKKWIKSVVKFGETIMNKVFETKQVVSEKEKTVYIKIENIKMIDFKKGLNERKRLYLIGYNSTKDYFYENNLKVMY